MQFPGFMKQYPCSTRLITTSFLLTPQWPLPHSEELLLAMEESDFDHKCNEIRKIDSNQTVIGKTTLEMDKEDFDNDANDDDDDADNAEQSEGDEFEQETG
ncbi:uncharacterized protein [Rutidosis leptorrhynchoides]|uniref:uncharacterized protein n=1 Tax=Rutidosis leptorrhynchoides TaxID=125765 RepID=UPI003A993A73